MTDKTVLTSPEVIAAVAARFGDPVVAALPAASPDGDDTAAFRDLRRLAQDADVVLFPDVWPGNLDAFFRLRLSQVLDDQPPSPGLSVVMLAPELAGPPLAGGFADRFRTAWPFSRCVFATDSPAALSRQLGLPVARLRDGVWAPEVLRTDARAGQKVALQIQITWGRCGGTAAFENQVESLVQAGFLTVRLFWNDRLRRGPTLDATLDRIIAENSVHAGAHISVLAVPDGPPPFSAAKNPAERAAARYLGTAFCRVTDNAVAAAARRADTVIANHIDTVGTAIHVAPAARLICAVHYDRAAAAYNSLRSAGAPPGVIAAEVAAAAGAQAGILAIPDTCAHLTDSDLARLGPHSQRAAIVLPRIYAAAVRQPTAQLFDVMAAGDAHAVNIASLKWFLDEVWRPHLAPENVRVAIAGRAGQRIAAAGYQSPFLHFLGFVDDLETFRSGCRLTVVPDRGGTGVSVKMLTTLAAGHPVVTTSAGLRGLERAVRGLLPAHDDPAAFAADVLRLLRDPDHLAERRRSVARAHEAMRLGPTWADLLRSVPPPGEPAIARRMPMWAKVVAAAPEPDPRPWVFEPGRDFPMSGTARDGKVLLAGWHEAEPWGRWTDGAEASLLVTLPAPTHEPLDLLMDIVPSPVGAPLTVGIDGVLADPVHPLAGRNAWPVPPGAASAKDRFVVTLRVGETVRPSDGGESGDTRILGIGVSAVAVGSRRPTLCVPEEFLPVNTEARPSGVLLEGWHGLEAWGVWTDGTTATLRLRAAEPLRGPVRLELDLEPTPACDTLTLSVNGWTAPARRMGAQPTGWDLPASAKEGRTELLVALTVPATFRPPGDSRVMGIGLRRVRLRRTDPVTITLGTPLPLAAPAELGGVLARNWHGPESWGCWTSGPAAWLQLDYGHALRGPFRLVLDLALPPVVPDITVAVNGTVFPARLPANGANEWNLPEGCTNGRAEISIELRVSRTYCAAERQGSGDDRVLGIGVRSVALHRAAPAFCPLGTRVPLARGHDDGGLVMLGWHLREDWGCWTAGREATLGLRFAAPLSGACRLEMDMAPPLLDANVSVAVNGYLLDDRAVLDGRNAWTVPAHCADGRTGLEVRIYVGRPARPIDVRDSADDRLLGVGVRDFALYPL